MKKASSNIYVSKNRMEEYRRQRQMMEGADKTIVEKREEEDADSGEEVAEDELFDQLGAP